MRRIAVLTSGGDGPGMNACLRAVVRHALPMGLQVIGIRRGYVGLLGSDFDLLDANSVANIMQRGGTVIGTGRSAEFHKPEARARAADNLRKAEIDGLIVIGGDGSFRGAEAMALEQGYPIVGVPGTIDNDVYGSDYTIGFHTAVSTALEAIDRIRDTAESTGMPFFIEVMGRRSGYIAAEVALAGGADYVMLPEVASQLDELCEVIEKALDRGKRNVIVVVSEGDETGGAIKVGEKVRSRMELEYRVTILGHVQRGGSPTAQDRLLATKLGVAAVDALADGKTRVMIGETGAKITITPFQDTWELHKPVDLAMAKLVRELSEGGR